MSTLDRRTLLRAAGASALAIPLARTQSALGVETPDGGSRLDRRIAELMAEAHIAGLGVAVTRGEHIKWTKGYGLANVKTGLRVGADTPFMLASISKTVTCTGVMQAVEDGLLDLDTDINTYLPWPVHNPHHSHDAITMRMLLTHTSSMKDDWHVFDKFYVPGDSKVALGAFLRRCLTPGEDSVRTPGVVPEGSSREALRRTATSVSPSPATSWRPCRASSSRRGATSASSSRSR